MAEKTYKNISNAPVLGNAPGKVFKVDPDDLPDGQLERMIARNSIKPVDEKALTEQDAPKESEETPETADEVAPEGKPEDKDGGAKAGATPPVPPVGTQPPAGRKR